MAKHGRTRSLMVAAALGSAFLAACGAGSGKVSGSVVTGMALSDAPIGGGAVTLTDSSSSVQARQVTTRSDGSFTVDVSGLTPPYMLEVQWTGSGGTQAMHAVSDATESDVTPITDLAFDHAAGDTGDEALFRTASATRKRIAVNQATAVLTDVAAELAPLLNQYGIADLSTDTPAVRRLLQDVEVTQSSGMVTFSNRRTGGVIARGPRTNPTGGTFDPSQIPTNGSSGRQPSGSSSGGTFDPCQMPTGAPPSSEGGGFPSSGGMPPSGRCPIPGSSGGTSSGGAASGGTASGCTSGCTARLPPNHPAISSGATCCSCHTGGMAPGGGAPGGVSSGGFHGSSGGMSSGGFPGSSGGASSSGTSSSSGGTVSGDLPANHPSVPAGSACSSCH